MKKFNTMTRSILFAALALPIAAQAQSNPEENPNGIYENCTFVSYVDNFQSDFSEIVGPAAYLKDCVTDYQSAHAKISHSRVIAANVWTKSLISKLFKDLEEGAQVRVGVSGYSSPYGHVALDFAGSIRINGDLTNIDYNFMPYYAFVK